MGGFDKIRLVIGGVVWCGVVSAGMIIGMSYKHELNNTLLRFAWS